MSGTRDRLLREWTPVAVAAGAVLLAGVLLRQHVADQVPAACTRILVCPDCPFYARAALRVAEGRPPGLGPLYSTLVASLGLGPELLRRSMILNGVALCLAAVLGSLAAALPGRGPIPRTAAVLGAGVVGLCTAPQLNLQIWLRPDATGAGLMALATLAGAWMAIRPGALRGLCWGLALGLLSGAREHGFAMAAAAVPAAALMGPLRPGAMARRGLPVLGGWLLVGIVPIAGWLWGSPEDDVSMLSKVLMPLQHAFGALTGGLQTDQHGTWGAALDQDVVRSDDLAALTWQNLGPARPLAVLALCSPVALGARSRAAGLAAAVGIVPLVLSFAMKTLPHHLLAMVPMLSGIALGAVGALGSVAGQWLRGRAGWVGRVSAGLLGAAPVGVAGLLLVEPWADFDNELRSKASAHDAECRSMESDAVLAEALRTELPPDVLVYGEQVRFALPVALAGGRWGGDFPGAWDTEGSMPGGSLVVALGPQALGWTTLKELPDGGRVLLVPEGLRSRDKEELAPGSAPPPPPQGRGPAN